MSKKRRSFIRTGIAWLLAFAMVVSTVITSDLMTITAQAEGAVTINSGAGYAEGAYVEWAPVEGAAGYVVKVNGTTIDDELIRSYGTYWRADALGLSAGDYTLTVEAYDSSNALVASGEKAVTVTAHDRSGYGWVDGTSSGAYNENGTLQSDAVVLYITESTKDTVSMDVVTNSKGTTTNAVGLQNILNLYKKGLDSRPLCIRLIGNITDFATMEGGDIVISGSSKTKTVSKITIEGVGKDAVANGWGLRIKSASNIEVRNIGFMNCDSSEGDDVGLQQDNNHIWVHHCDMFYGGPGGDSDQAKGDGALDCKKSTYVTFSYNHFWDTGKSNLLGLSEGTTSGLFITYHHNWYDHSDSRHPRVRYYTAHVYNNYYDGNAKYGVGSTLGSSVFVENNYFRNVQYPILTSMQGSDVFAGGTTRDVTNNATFSKEAGGSIKAFGNIMTGNYTFIPYGAANYTLKGTETAYNLSETTSSADFDAYVAESRTTTVPDTVVSYTGGNKYNNFDTASGFYTYQPDAAEDVPAKVTANAGRVQGGDFTFDFDNSVDDTSYALNTALKSALVKYTTSLKSIGGKGTISVEKVVATYTVTFDPNNGTDTTSTQKVESGKTVSAPDVTVPSGKQLVGWYKLDSSNQPSSIWKFSYGVSSDMTLQAVWADEEADLSSYDGYDDDGGTDIGTKTIVYDITKEGLTNEYFTVTGSLKSGTYTGSYNGITYSGKPLKMDSKGKVSFSTGVTAKLVLVYGKGSKDSAGNKINIVGYQEKIEIPSNDVVEIAELPAGSYTVERYSGESYLCAIWIIPEGDTEDNIGGEDPADVTKYTVSFQTNGGSEVQSQQVAEGKKAVKPADPAREGFVFAGWYTEATLTNAYSFDTAVTGDITLFAKWEAGETTKYTLDCSKDLASVKDASNNITESTTINGFKIYAAPGGGGADQTSPKYYWTVGDGYLGTNGVLLTDTNIAGNADGLLKAIEFTAEHEGTLTVEFASSSTSGTKLVLAHKVDGVLTVLDSMEYAKTEKTAKSFTLPAADTYYLYADPTVTKGIRYYSLKLTEKTQMPTYTVTFQTNGAAAVDPQTVEEGQQAVKPADPTKTGFTFTGWYTDEACTVLYDFNTAVMANLTLYAGWTGSSSGSTHGGADHSGLHVELVEGDEFYYTGTAIKPVIEVWNDDEYLIEGVDYTVKYANNIKASTAKKATITVTGKGNLTGKAVKEFTILPRDLADVTTDEAVYVVSGSKANPVMVFNGIKLTAKDYTITPDAKTKYTADGTITIKGKGNFGGELKDWPVRVIQKSDLKKFTVTVSNVTAENKDLSYTGEDVRPAVTVKDATGAALADTDYTIIWPEDTVNAGTVKFTVLGFGFYTGSVTKTYKIKPAAGTVKVVLDSNTFDYTPNGVTVDKNMTVTVNDKEVYEGWDYTVSHSANKKVGTGKYTVKFIGNYKGIKPVTGTFTIKAASLSVLNSEGAVKVQAADKTAKKAGAYKSVPYVSVDGAAVKNSDLTVKYYVDPERTKEMGSAATVNPTADAPAIVYVRIQGKGNFAAQGNDDYVDAEYKVWLAPADKTKDLSKAKIVDKTTGKAISKQEYTGEEVQPEVAVKIGSTTLSGDALEAACDVEYISNVSKGKATVVITAKEGSGYAGGKAQNFTITSRNLKNVKDLFQNLKSALGL